MTPSAVSSRQSLAIEACEDTCAWSVKTWGTCCVRGDAQATARDQTREHFGQTLSVPIVKNLDDQMPAALLALRQALERATPPEDGWRDWAVVGSPCRPGRVRMADNLARYPEIGARSVSPYLVPHCSLHSMSGIVSQVLAAHGPNLGTGGMPGTEHEALWAAWTLLAEGAPGVWVLWTGWGVEPTLDHVPPDARCLGVALAMERADAPQDDPPAPSSADQPPFTLERLYESLTADHATRESIEALCSPALRKGARA